MQVKPIGAPGSVILTEGPPDWLMAPGVPYPDNNPKTAFGAVKLPLHLVPPSATAGLARALADGAKKYGPYNWRDKTISASVYYAACKRHLDSWWDGEDLAADSGVHHWDHAEACIALLRDAASIGKLNDDRPTKGAAAQMQLDWKEQHDTTAARPST